jgi:hypothetical protein
MNLRYNTSAVSVISNNDLPREVIFDRYFREYPEWSVRSCYLGRQVPLKLIERFGQELAQMLDEARNLLNERFKNHTLCLDSIKPILHFDYIEVKEPQCPAEDAPPRANAIAFVHKRIHFVGITIPLVIELLRTAQRLVSRGRITRLFNAKPHRATELFSVLFTTMVEFVFLHEIGHHVHGHQGEKASKQPTLYYDETVAATENSLVSQAKEIEADGYATNALLEKFRFDPPRATALNRLRARYRDASERQLFLLILLASAGALIACGIKTFALNKPHPPKGTRLHFVAARINDWAKKRSATAPAPLKLKQYQRLMTAVRRALDRQEPGALDEEAAFLSSSQGKDYLNAISDYIPHLRERLAKWRWEHCSKTST